MTFTRLSLAVGGLLTLLATPAGVGADLAFPPPEFETDYTMPGILTPPPRGLALEYLDVAVLFAALGVAAWLVHARRSRRGLAALSLFSLLYFGFYREGCICAIGAPQNVAYGLFNPGYTIPLTALAFFLLPLVFSLFSAAEYIHLFAAAVAKQGTNNPTT